MAYLGKDATEEWVMIHKPGAVNRLLGEQCHFSVAHFSFLPFAFPGTVEKNMQHLVNMGKASEPTS